MTIQILPDMMSEHKVSYDALLQVDDKEEFGKVLHEVKHNVAPLDAPVPPDPSQAVMASESRLSDLHTRILRKASRIAFPTEPNVFYCIRPVLPAKIGTYFWSMLVQQCQF